MFWAFTLLYHITSHMRILAKFKNDKRKLLLIQLSSLNFIKKYVKINFVNIGCIKEYFKFYIYNSYNIKTLITICNI